VIWDVTGASNLFIPSSFSDATQAMRLWSLMNYGKTVNNNYNDRSKGTWEKAVVVYF
jgi:hypothetical protein